jgi:hypothetical protein
MAGIEYQSRSTGNTGAWVQDELDRAHVLEEVARLDAAAFPVLGQVTVTAPSGAALGATSITVTALDGPIPAGTVLDFTGTGELAILTACAVDGATTLAVGALDAAIEAGDTATYAPAGARRFVASGTLVGRTYTERGAGAGFGPYAGGDEEVYLVVHDVFDADVNPEVTLYRHGSLVSEKYLPSGVNLTQVRANYQTVPGRA